MMMMMMVMVMVVVMVMMYDPCKNALTAPEPLLASARSFSNISTILVLKNT